MNALDPKAVFRRLRDDIPRALHRHVFVVGSLAAAYHFRKDLPLRAVNTKDADLVIHPAGDVRSCAAIAERLFRDDWTLLDPSYAHDRRGPADQLPYLRLKPPRSDKYFVEFLGLPRREQREAKTHAVVRVRSKPYAGRYGLPSFRFMGLAATRRLRSQEGLTYAAPSLMALANLLSHPRLGADTVGGGTLLRSAKDLGRAIAIARLSAPAQIARWPDEWRPALRACFPKSWAKLANGAGAGLRALLADADAFEQAHQSTATGLLAGLRIAPSQLRVAAEQLLASAVEPLAATPPR